MKTITTIFLILVGLISLEAQTVITGGDVFGEWKKADSPFLIEGDIYLQPEDRLVIRPGVEVVFQGYFSFDIAGRVEILGTESDSILFTVQDTSGYFLGDHAGWNGLIFNGWYTNLEEFSVMNYCVVEYSKISGITCIGYPKLQLSNTNIRFNQSTGIALHEFSDIEMNNIHIYDNMGGGISCNSSAPVVNDFTIFNNQGSGISIYGNSMGSLPRFINGKIKQNTTAYSGGGIRVWDAGIYAENLEILSNTATNGGGIDCDMSSGEFRNVIISENVAENGGGIQTGSFTYLVFDHVLLADNHANAIGGGAYIFESNVDFVNTTITNNTAVQGGGIYYNLYSFYENEIANSIIWNNLPDGIFSTFESPLVNFSNISGGLDGIGNITEDPLFADPSNHDYRLQWSNFPNENGDKSPCIDAGDPSSIFDPDGTISDMGAYYYDQIVYTSVYGTVSSDEILVYPNPAIDEMIIKSSKDVKRIQLVSLMGNVVIEQFLNGAQTYIIDLTGINPGIHILNIYDSQGLIETKKIVKN